jgi:hypothetical protein
MWWYTRMRETVDKGPNSGGCPIGTYRGGETNAIFDVCSSPAKAMDLFSSGRHAAGIHVRVFSRHRWTLSSDVGRWWRVVVREDREILGIPSHEGRRGRRIVPYVIRTALTLFRTDRNPKNYHSSSNVCIASTSWTLSF